MKARIPNQPQGQSQAQMMQKLQKMQDEMAEKQQEVENSEFTASAGGGEVEVTVTGKHQVVRIDIKPDVVDPEDIEMLEDLLMAAMNEATRKADEAMESAVSSATNGLNIPGLDGLF